MNKGTKLRTIALIVTIINQAFVSIGDVDFGNPTANLVYKVVSTLLTIAASAAALWYNNDFTEAGCIGTGITRQIKRELDPDYVGDRFFTDASGDLIIDYEVEPQLDIDYEIEAMETNVEIADEEFTETVDDIDFGEGANEQQDLQAD